MIKKLTIYFFSWILLIPAVPQSVNIDTPVNHPPEINKNELFTTVVDLGATEVKDQSRTNTCWSFATTSFIESELIRKGNVNPDLSEMYIVRRNYIDRLIDNYNKLGRGNTDEGGLPHDWLRVFSRDGIVPESVYPGINYESKNHNHSELQAYIKALAPVPVQIKYENPRFFSIVNSVLDAFLGPEPDTFLLDGVRWTPISYAQYLGIRADDYIEITSFTHLPYYTKSLLEVPDNWTGEKIYNVHLDELISIIDYSLHNGYTVLWDGDTSEEGFAYSKGIATLRIKSKPADISDASDFKEETVTPASRQKAFETSETTDDHGMHITGMVTDITGRKYYKTKNSWGTDNNPLGGYINLSENYVRAKTILILVNKNGIPPEIRKKIGV